MELTDQHKRWFNRLRNVLTDIPDGMEIIIDGDGHVSVYEEGALKRHLSGSRDGWAISSGEELPICGFRVPRLYPYGEGT